MASTDKLFPVGDCCEICGVPLGDEVVIQEFADGSLARLCKECAAGTALDEHGRQALAHDPPPAEDKSREAQDKTDQAQDKSSQTPSFLWPEVEVAPAGPRDESDPLEKTRELLTPINELIALQREMQSALERLAASLERFAAEMITESQDKTAVESRLRTLEIELDKTRALLQETDLSLASAPAVGPSLVGGPAVEPSLVGAPAVGPLPDTGPAPSPPPAFAGEQALREEPESAPAVGEEPRVVPAAAAPSVPAGAPPGPETEPETSFRLEEVQLTQRYYNESRFVHRIRDIVENLGKPRANLTRVPGATPRALVTIYWDIVWYQYLVDLRRDLPSDHERVTLYREGMDLEQLAYYYKEKNAIVNDDGRLDASELEVRLLSDPSALITEMSAEEARLLDDATEEIWGQHSAPEFKWDD